MTEPAGAAAVRVIALLDADQLVAWLIRFCRLATALDALEGHTNRAYYAATRRELVALSAQVADALDAARR